MRNARLAWRVGITLLILIHVASAISLGAVAAPPTWVKSQTLPFNGGAIVDYYPVSESAAIVLAAMPDGFSIYSLDFVSGGIVKLVSQTYLQSLIPDSSDADDLKMCFEPASGLLLLKPQAGRLAPVLLNLSSAPYLTKYTLGLPEGYTIGATAFAWDKLYLSPSLEYAAGGSPALVVFDPKSNKLQQVQPERKLALMEEMLFVPERDALLLKGAMSASSQTDGTHLAWMGAEGAVEIIPGTDGVLLASACPGAISYVLAGKETAAPSDVSPYSYRLAILPTSSSDEEKISLVLNTKPTWLAVAEGGKTALVIVDSAGSFGDLWAVDTSSRSRVRLRENVMAVRMSPNCDACVVLPADKNQLELYTPGANS